MSTSAGDGIWSDRVLPILEAIKAHEGDDMLDLHTLVGETGLTAEAIDVELKRLIRSGYVGGEYKELWGGPLASMLMQPMLTERGSRCVGLWPSDDPYELLMNLLDERIDEEQDEEELSRLQRLKRTVADVGKGTVAGVLVELAKAGAGMRF